MGKLTGIFFPGSKMGRRLLFRSVFEYPDFEDGMKMVNGRSIGQAVGLSSTDNFSLWKTASSKATAQILSMV